MPALASQEGSLGFLGWALLAGVGSFFAYLIWQQPWFLAVIPAMVAFQYFDEKRRKRKFTALGEERSQQSICEFARSFDKRSVDTWVIRAVYEQIQEYVSMSGVVVPIQAKDSLFELLEIDSDDLDMDLVAEIAERTGRSLEGWEKNPWHGKVETVGDLVHFFVAQPLVDGT